MTDTDSEPPNESGIRKFIRGILPHWSRSSPQGGNTPIHNESTYAGIDGTKTDTSQELKRKSSLLRNDDDSDDSDYEENLPSHKRQRVTVSAMRRLFAKFSLSDKDTKDAPNLTTSTSGENTQAWAAISQQNIPRTSSDSELPALIPALTRDNSEDLIVPSNSNNNTDDIPNMNKCSNNVTVKRETTSYGDTNGTLKGKKQKLTHSRDKPGDKIENSDNEESKSENTNKRQADVNDSDDDNDEENGNKVKRTRRLRRGLRLCTNITCYIEQVLYN